MIVKLFKYAFSAFLFVIFLSGCAAITGHKDSLNEFDKKVRENSCDFIEIEERVTSGDDPILWSIQGGSLARNCKDYQKSNQLLDYTEVVFKEEVDQDGVVSNAVETTASVLVNSSASDYEGNTYDKIMVNTYKALNFMSLGDFANARVEFNRALDRQRKAKEYFEEEIAEAKEKQEKEKKDFQKKQNEKKSKAKETNSPDSIIKNPSTQKIVYEQYNNIFKDFKAYPDFVNPFATYMAGLFFMLDNDAAKGRDLLKEAVGMVPSSFQIKSDFELSNKIVKNQISKNEKYIWVIYENGNSMKRNEKNIKVPLFLAAKNPFPVNIAFPIISEDKASHMYVSANDEKTTEIANMDRVIKTEFQKRYTMLLTEILMSNIFKAIMQYQLQQKAGIVGGITGMLYQITTNTADTRSWTALPKNFQSVRVPNLGEAIVIKDDKGAVIETVEVPKDKNVILYLRSEVPQNNRLHKIIF